MAGKSESKILTLNLGGKKGVNIDLSKYNLVKDAIIKNLESVDSATLLELSQKIKDELNEIFNGKAGWYYMAVKLDLEVREIIERIPKSKPQLLKLK